MGEVKLEDASQTLRNPRSLGETLMIHDVTNDFERGFYAGQAYNKLFWHLLRREIIALWNAFAHDRAALLNVSETFRLECERALEELYDAPQTDLAVWRNQIRPRLGRVEGWIHPDGDWDGDVDDLEDGGTVRVNPPKSWSAKSVAAFADDLWRKPYESLRYALKAIEELPQSQTVWTERFREGFECGMLLDRLLRPTDSSHGVVDIEWALLAEGKTCHPVRRTQADSSEGEAKAADEPTLPLNIVSQRFACFATDPSMLGHGVNLGQVLSRAEAVPQSSPCFNILNSVHPVAWIAFLRAEAGSPYEPALDRFIARLSQVLPSYQVPSTKKDEDACSLVKRINKAVREYFQTVELYSTRFEVVDEAGKREVRFQGKVVLSAAKINDKDKPTARAAVYRLFDGVTLGSILDNGITASCLAAPEERSNDSANLKNDTCDGKGKDTHVDSIHGGVVMQGMPQNDSARSDGSQEVQWSKKQIRRAIQDINKHPLEIEGLSFRVQRDDLRLKLERR